uniref:G-protein coupled receptors family 1 profile domain-containing protein n=1 Tax=Branchiostoma floridae TaxID=7739 RepID=C3YZP1_BRAFL|eukprot:XP_002598300.1 hypothetical protein BRAFLDRAFT_69654 [Branchiostoma floridae]
MTFTDDGQPVELGVGKRENVEACLPCGNLTECVPRSKHCDNRTDCSNGADEENCGDNKGIPDSLENIPLVLRPFAIPKHCELQEVPSMCSCSHLTRIRCGGIGLTDIPANISVQVTRLYLDHNQLQTLEPGVFSDLSKLEWLFLNNNQLQVLNAQAFYGLHSLTWLELRWNRIHAVVGEGIWDNMPMLGILVVRNNSIEVINELALAELTQLHGLDLSENKIAKFPNGVFRNLSALDLLDLRGIVAHNMSFRLFRPLRKLEHIYFSEFRYCGFAPRVRRCTPNTDGISTFENLLANFVLRMSVWVVAIVTCVGNTSVMIGRSIMKHENKVHSLFIRNLCGSMYAWIVVFILPINSAINPILYSLTTRTFTNMLGNLVEKSPCCARKTKSGRLRQQKEEAFSGATYTTGVASVLRPVKCFKVKRSSETEFSMSTVSTPTCSENTTKAFVSTIEIPDVVHRSSTLNSVPEVPSLEISGKESETDLDES